MINRALIIAALPAILLAGCGGAGIELTCGQPATEINAIQGRELSSGLLGQVHRIEAIATLRLTAADGSLLGAFVQAPNSDADPRTSEGLFAAGADLDAGRRYRLAGEVVELGDKERGLTALRVAASRDCGAAELPAAEPVELPLDRHIEALEGMRVLIEGALTVSGNYRLGSHAQITVAAGTRLYQATEITDPGGVARSLEKANLRRSLVLDDASMMSNPGAIAWWPQPAGELPRAGDVIARVSGVIGDWEGYRLHLSEPVKRTFRARRPPPPRRAGNLRVVVYNLLNFFNGDGRGGGFPTARGAASETEFARQKAKTISAMIALDGDLLALSELENDGSGDNSAILELAAALAADSGRDYRPVVIPEGGLGDDAIAVGMIYDAAVLAPAGAARTNRRPPFDALNRPPLLATFEHSDSGISLTAVAVHLKSKGCGEATGANTDQGDGQGCWNATRTQATRALVQWLGTLSGVAPASTLMMGDFNAYSREDPLSVLDDNGYQRLINTRRRDYSFVYRGRAGSLDHAFAGPGLTARLARAAIWHVNADEPAWIDYRMTGKPADDPLYAPSPYRSSDHDPLVLDFKLP